MKWSAIVLGSVVTIGGFLGIGANPAWAQAAPGAAGTGGARISPGRTAATPPTVYRRYYYYDYRTQRYYYYDVADGTTNVARYPTTGRTVVPRAYYYRSRRSAAGIGAQGTDGRTSVDEWGSP